MLVIMSTPFLLEPCQLMTRSLDPRNLKSSQNYHSELCTLQLSLKAIKEHEHEKQFPAIDD
jgi:hypothetical protein